MKRTLTILTGSAAALVLATLPAAGQCNSATTVTASKNAAECSTKCAVTAQLVSLGALADATQGDIVDVAVSAGSFNTLVAAVKAAGLVDVLKCDGPFTVFAPTDAAFAKLPKETLDTLLKPENKPLLAAILTYHVVPGRVAAADVLALNAAQTANGQRISFSMDGDSVKVGDATITNVDIRASNGIIHVIDTVILPSTDDIISTAVNAGSFKTLAAALDAAGLISALHGDGPFTVFAPTDDAFAKLPRGTVDSLLQPENRDTLIAVLKYHVVPGRVYAADAVGARRATTLQGGVVRIDISSEGRLTVNGANVIGTNIDCTNGVVHIIDQVILP